MMLGVLVTHSVVRGSEALTIYTEVAPPYMVKLPDGEMGGAAVDVVRAIQRRVHNASPIQEVPWARSYRALQLEPNVLLFLVARTAQRNPLFHWVGPISESVFGLYVKSDSPIVLNNLEDAKRLKSIGVYRDDARDQLLTQYGFNNLDRTVGNIPNVKKLMADRIDAFASSTTSVDALMESAQVPREKVREALPFHTSQTWLAFSKNTPDITITDWTAAFEAMKKDKTFEKIMKAGAPNWVPPKKPIVQF